MPSLDALKKEGEAGRKVINQYTRYGTVLLAVVQAYGIAVGLEGGTNIVIDPGLFFRITAVVTLTGGTMFLMWLGEQITARGIGNGISLIIFAGIVASLPACAGRACSTSSRQGALPVWVWHWSSIVRRRGDPVHRLHGAGPAPADHPVSEAPGRQPDVPGRGPRICR